MSRTPKTPLNENMTKQTIIPTKYLTRSEVKKRMQQKSFNLEKENLLSSQSLRIDTNITPISFRSASKAKIIKKKETIPKKLNDSFLLNFHGSSNDSTINQSFAFKTPENNSKNNGSTLPSVPKMITTTTIEELSNENCIEESSTVQLETGNTIEDMSSLIQSTTSFRDDVVRKLESFEAASKDMECLKSLNTDVHCYFLSLLQEDRSGMFAQEILSEIKNKFNAIYDPTYWKAMIKFDSKQKPYFEFVTKAGLEVFKGIEHCCPYYEHHNKLTLMMSDLIYDKLYETYLSI